MPNWRTNHNMSKMMPDKKREFFIQGYVGRGCFKRGKEEHLKAILKTDSEWELCKRAEEKDDIKVRITVEEIS